MTPEELERLRKALAELEKVSDLTEDEIKYLRSIMGKLPLELIVEVVLMVEDRRHRQWLVKVVKNSLAFIGLVITTLFLTYDKLIAWLFT